MTLVAVTSLTACDAKAPSTNTAGPQPIASIQEIMQALVDPSADALWESVSTTVTSAGTDIKQPANNAEWIELRHLAVRVAEAANLLVSEGRVVAHAISKSDHLVAATLQIVHVFGLILLLTAQVILALRLFNLIFKLQPLPDIAQTALRIFWIGLALAFFSGALMFIASPKLYYFKWAFQLKMLLLAAGLIVQTTLLQRAVHRPSTALIRIAVTLSLLLWFGVGMAGRIIGFI